jgi:hypothetical protein
MMPRRELVARATLAALAVLLFMASARADDESDLRGFRVGMRSQDLPHSGYQAFSCAAAPSRHVSGWQDYPSCPADASGLHEVRFQYDRSGLSLGLINDRYEGTKVGGHPMLLSVLINDQGLVAAIRMETDPEARPYLRKKAFLFGPQAMQRYGEEGWSCAQRPPDQGEQPIGGIFIKEQCEKTTATRRFIVERALLRRPDQDLKDFVSMSRLTILQRQ